MGLKPNKGDAKAVLKVLQENIDIPESELDDWMGVAELVVAAAFERYEKAGKYVVVGQLMRKNDSTLVDPHTGDATKISLGLYRTPKQADDAALALTGSHVTHETFRSWTLPVHHGTPHDWFRARKADGVHVEHERATQADRLVEMIEQEAAAKKAAREMEVA